MSLLNEQQFARHLPPQPTVPDISDVLANSQAAGVMGLPVNARTRRTIARRQTSAAVGIVAKNSPKATKAAQ